MPDQVLFARIAKVDEATRTVYGRAVQEVKDKSGETFDYASSKPFFQKWSEVSKDASGGQSVGNLRAMHGKVAAGKLTQIEFKDDECAIDIAAKVVDDAEWGKVTEGVYTGFSIGGSYIRKWDDEDGNKRYTADPSEISLVDRGCVPTATFFSITKIDGSTVDVPFAKTDEPAKAEPEEYEVAGKPEDVEKLATLMGVARLDVGGVIAIVEGHLAKAEKPGEVKYGAVKFADTKNKKYPIETEDHIRAAWSYVNKAKNADKYSADELKVVKDNIIAAWKSKIDKDGPPSAAADTADKAEPVGTLAKGLYTCGSLSSFIQSLAYMTSSVSYEEASEQDGSDLSARLKACVADLCEILKDMVAEETAELLATTGATNNSNYLEMAETVGDLVKRCPVLEKAGARNSKSDMEKIQAMHDHTSDLGAMCKVAAPDKNIAQVEPAGDLAKVDAPKIEAPNDLSKALEHSAALEKSLSDVVARLAKLEAQPVAPKAILRAVTKGEDASLDPVTPAVHAVMKDGKIDEVATMIKLVQMSGGKQLIQK